MAKKTYYEMWTKTCNDDTNILAETIKLGNEITKELDKLANRRLQFMSRENLNTSLLAIIVILLCYIIFAQHGTQRYVPWFKYNAGILDTTTGNGYLPGDRTDKYGEMYIMGEKGLERKQIIIKDKEIKRKHIIDPNKNFVDEILENN